MRRKVEITSGAS